MLVVLLDDEVADQPLYAPRIESADGFSTGAHMRLTGKVALVTGAGQGRAGQGMGQAIARCFAQEVAILVALDLNLEAAQESLAGLGGRSIARTEHGRQHSRDRRV